MIVLQGQDNPRVDVPNLNSAFLFGSFTGRTVKLVGHFDVGNFCIGCVQIRRPVTVVGTGDPTVPQPRPNETTIIKGGSRGGARAPLIVNMDRNAPGGEVNISRIWFDKASAVQLGLVRTFKNTKVTLAYNRHTGLSPINVKGVFRFAIAAANPFGTVSEVDRGIIETQGEITIDHTYVNNLDVRFTIGDDNACGFARWEYDKVTLTNNTFITRGECEFEGGFNPNATLVASGNKIIMDGAPSRRPFDVPNHPTALKLNGNEAKSVMVSDNHILAYGSPQGICMMVTNVITPAGAATETTIRNNTCDMQGSGAAIVGCSFDGTEAGFPIGELSNAVVTGNTIRGTARVGIGFYDFDPTETRGMICRAHGNRIVGNDQSGLRASEASVFFDRQTRDNLFIGSTGIGRVVDLGTNNRIITP